MRTTARRAATGVAAAALAALLTLPTAGAAQAQGSRPSATDRHAAAVQLAASARDSAARTLHQALRAADSEYLSAMKSARNTFTSSPAVVAARAIEEGEIAVAFGVLDISAHTASDYTTFINAVLSARDTFRGDSRVAKDITTRDDAYDAARAAWIASANAAWSAYYVATMSAGDAAAASTYRAAVQTATLNRREAVRAAEKAYLDAPGMRVAITTRDGAEAAARYTYEQSSKLRVDRITREAAVWAARADFAADPAVVSAKAIRASELATARSAYRADVNTAKAAYTSTTQRRPPLLPRLLPV